MRWKKLPWSRLSRAERRRLIKKGVDQDCRLSYGARNRRLREMGFRSYQVYLDSDLWRSIREKVFTVLGRVCHFCGALAIHVHHRRYSLPVLRGEDLRALFPVCDRCHGESEFMWGFKVEPGRATDRMKRFKDPEYLARVKTRDAALRQYRKEQHRRSMISDPRKTPKPKTILRKNALREAIHEQREDRKRDVTPSVSMASVCARCWGERREFVRLVSGTCPESGRHMVV